MKESHWLNSIRAEILQVTLDIISLVGKRTRLVSQITREKQQLGIPIVNREVERKLRERVLEQCKTTQTDPVLALRILDELLIGSIRQQGELLVTEEPVSAYHIFVKATELESSGKEVIHLEVGEPDFGPPEAVVEAMTHATKEGHAGYTKSAGILQLRNKIADHLNNTQKLDIEANQVIVTVGARFALFLSLSTSLQTGDEVIVIDPSYPAYADCIKQVGARPVHLSTSLDDEWKLNVEELENIINETTKMIILNSPDNPTGRIFDSKTLEEIVDLSIENGIQIVSDEVYSEYAFSSHTSVLQFPHCSHVYVNSFSKTFGMTGFRLGYAISDVERVEKMTRLQNLSLTCVPEFIQYAGVKALDCTEETKGFAEMIQTRQELVCKELSKIPVSFQRPDGGFYIFPKLRDSDMTGFKFAEKLLAEKGVAVVPGIAYGSQFSKFFRISVCQPKEKLIEAVRRMGEIIG